MCPIVLDSGKRPPIRRACAYMIGNLKSLELRKRAREALGDRFDLGNLHDRVLASGALRLALLERVVADGIAAQAGARA